jgi:basic amino acid/polyamine antiporter, APA family
VSDTTTEHSPPRTELRRVMGPKLLLLFVVGDILGTGVYALTGEVAAEVGGAAWAPFLLAFVVATLTACSYLELVTKYPQAAGAALYTHKAFGVHFLTFLVAFTVMSSGITSASTASQAFADNLVAGAGLGGGDTAVTVIALGFMTLVAVVNFRGVAESVKANVVLTLVELTGLLIIILIGFWVIGRGEGDMGAVVAFETSGDKNVFVAVTAATSLAFFAMVGFEDSVNMAEETKDPSRVFPKVMLTGLGVTGLIYVLVSIAAVAIVPVGQLADSSVPPLLRVVEAGAPGLPINRLYPFITMVAVANSALINMLMASRLLYGMAKEDVLPRVLGRVHPGRRTPWASIVFTTLIAFGLIIAVSGFMGEETISTLGGTTALLLLGVFTVVNVAVLVLRRNPVEHASFRAPTAIPVLGAVTCAFLVGPWTGRDTAEYKVGGVLLLAGVVLWLLTWMWNRGVRAKHTGFRDIEHLGE